MAQTPAIDPFELEPIPRKLAPVRLDTGWPHPPARTSEWNENGPSCPLSYSLVPPIPLTRGTIEEIVLP
jgi:hypothetical protein